MNDFTYDELKIGQTAEFSRVITVGMMEKFSSISGDINPLHMDDDFAKKKGFTSRVVYGMLTASLYSCLVGVYIPGKQCLLQSVHSDFLGPVFVGDRLDVLGEIIGKNDTVRQIIIRAVIRNQNGKKVSRSKIETGVLL